MIAGFRLKVGFIFFTRLFALTATLALIVNSKFIVAAEPVTFEFSTEEKTIGDIKPPFIDFSSEASPLVPAKEVIRRYRLLFNTTADPVIRVDALLRITALEQRFGSDQELSEADEIQMHRRALASFEQLMSSADPVYPVDMLLYQSARSQDALGQREKAIASLKRLVGQFPRSDFATESWFRLAEFAFSEGEYRAAEKAYQKVLSAGVGTRFHSKAGFMLGWSVFKQGRQDEALARFTQFLDLMYADNADFDQLEGINLQTVQDTLRIMSIVFSYSEHRDPIDQLFSSVGRKPYADRLYRNLSDFYLNQERYEDSVTVNRNFIERNPGSNAAPLFAVKIIDTYKAARFSQQVWDEKRLFVQNYGLRSGFLLESGEERRGNITPSLKAYLNDLSHLDFVAAQSAKKADARNQLYLRAAEYYEEYADLDSGAEDAGEKLHLAAEGYFRAGKFEKAAQVYYRSAYLVAKHKDSHESGYSALVALDRLAANEQTGDSANESRQIKYALKFAESFPKDKRTPQVLSVAANDLLSGGNYLRAADVARRIVEIGSQDGNVLKAAWLVQGQAQFEMGEFGQSEKALLAALKLIPKKDQQYVIVTEQIAAAIYKAAEIANKRGQWQQAVEDYLRIEKIAPDSPIRINARYDAAAELLNRKEWKRAIPVLVEFRQDFPEHALTQSISEKLIVAYLNSEQDLYAADELERFAAQTPDAEVARKALYQAAELFIKAGQQDRAIRLYTKYEAQYPAPYVFALEARQQVANYYLQRKQTKRHHQWLRKIIEGDRQAGAERTDRSILLAAEATLVFAEEAKMDFDKIQIRTPLKKSLSRKKASLKEVVELYQQVAAYGVSQLATQSTYQLASVYGQLSRDLLNAEIPSSLDELQAEQYMLLLEEQAYPFEEKSIELHETNIQHTRNAVFDKWIQESYRELAKIFPVRYVRDEKVIGSTRELF